jgi:hypothetical protein
MNSRNGIKTKRKSTLGDYFMQEPQIRNRLHSWLVMTARALALAAAVALVPTVADADPASGIVSYRSKAGAIVVKIANAYLVKVQMRSAAR